MKVGGLDLSLTSTGAALVRGGKVLNVARYRTVPEDGADVVRADYIATAVVEFFEANGGCPDWIAIEDYAHSRATNVSRLGELGGIVKRALWQELGYDPDRFVKANIGTVKLFATGYGRASKRQMVEATGPLLGAFDRRLQTCDDVCDAVQVALQTESVKA